MKVSFVRRVRTMNAADAANVVEFILRFYPFAEKLGHLLPVVLGRLLEDDALQGVVVDYLHDDKERPEMAAFGLSAFVSEASAKDHLASPAPHFEFALLERALKGEPVFLTYDEIAKANAESGLTLFPMLWLQRTNDPADPEAHILLGLGEKTFWERHRGYRLGRILKEAPAELREAFLGGGFTERRHFRAGEALNSFPGVTLEKDRILFTVERAEVEAHWPPSVAGQLFAFQEPRCRFTRAEQQVLIRAADGLTDAKIAQGLGISPTAVALRWRSIYARLLECAPAVLRFGDEEANGSRGQEKRRTVVAFINEHPEELRPYGCLSRRHNHNHAAAEA